jgi:prepilin-type N-terminal cleavage/methylation domain-containing protein
MNGKAIKVTGSSGFSIIELIVVVSIIGILLTIAIPNFGQWQRKTRAESQVKEMVTDFSELRVRAMTRKQRHSITLNARNYVFKSYSSEEEPLAAGTPVPPATATTPSRTVSTALKSNSATFYGGTVFEIDHRGMLVGNVGTIYLDDNNSGATVDCLTLDTVRINPGKKNSGWSNCDDK